MNSFNKYVTAAEILLKLLDSHHQVKFPWLFPFPQMAQTHWKLFWEILSQDKVIKTGLESFL